MSAAAGAGANRPGRGVPGGSLRVLVTDGGERSALSTVRSLGRAGCEVMVCAERIPSLAGSSRYAMREFLVPDAIANPVAFVDALADLARRWSIDVLLPMSDQALSVILPVRERFGGVRIPFPEEEVYRRASDKRELLRVAERIGIPVPEQRVVETRGQGRDLVESRIETGTGRSPISFPVVVKPSRSVAGENGNRRKLRVAYARGPEELREILDGLPEVGFPVLIQRKIRGEGRGVFLLMSGGDPAAVFAHRRIREKPPSGGVSVYRESIRPDPSLVRLSVELLADLGWEGVAMVEYKVEEGTGTPYLMEVNGRFWGSLQLAVDAGVDFPALLVRAALGETLPPPPDYREGVRLRWLLGDVDHLIARVRQPKGYGTGGLRALGELVGSWRPGEHLETFRLSDPRPFLRESLDWARGNFDGVWSR